MKVMDMRGLYSGGIMDMLQDRARLVSGDYLSRVREIVESVKKEGDKSLLQFTLEFDGIRLGSDRLKVDPKQIANAYDAIDSSVVNALKRARDNIWDFHSRQAQRSWFVQGRGTMLGQMVSPIDSVGVYVPGGSAAYPSSVLMNVIPAKVAGVKRIVMITPPGRPDIRPEVIVAAELAGVDEIYRVGGAQGIAALAYGTESIKSVDKIVGPGNVYVAVAKRLVFGDVGIDMIAGPSEILIIADDGANPVHAAADMISQAEHDEMASSILITTSETLIAAVQAEIDRQLDLLGRKTIARRSLDNYGALVLVSSLEQACSLANRVAPEHLELMVKEPMELLGNIKNAGAIFMGYYSPEPLGDYMAGPNHVLPTGRTARFSSSLSVEQFIKKSSLIYYSKDALYRVKDEIITLAAAEGLEGHGRSVKVRFEQDDR